MDTFEQLERLERINTTQTTVPSKSWLFLSSSSKKTTPSSEDAGINRQPDKSLHLQELKKQREKRILLEQLDLGYIPGLQFTNVSITSDGDDAYMEECTLCGSCYELPFTLKLRVEKREVSDTAVEIKDLAVHVPEKMHKDMETFKEKCEEERDLQCFFSIFIQYAEWCHHRQRAFTHFKQEYPEAVKLPHGVRGAYMQFSHPTNCGPVYTVHWEIIVEDAKLILPVISLVVKAPKEMHDMDEKDTLTAAPAMFNKMLRSLGIAKAINAMIRVTCS